MDHALITYTDPPPSSPFGARQQGAQVAFNCSDGYVKAGNQGERTCESGRWDGDVQRSASGYNLVKV